MLVWLHGGGYASGLEPELRPYDGERLAREHDVVLVSANHRLNVLGFLDLSQIGGEKYASSGNVGMLDLVSALQWVRDNVAQFGGDPGNVTIFGQSGGGGKVTTLMGMPAAKGLFHKAVAISGSLFSFGTPDGATKLANGVLTELGIGKDDLAKLHTIPASQLVAAAFAAQAKVSPFAFPKLGATSLELGWQPLVDGKVLPTRPFDPTAPAESANVPFLVGNTFHEFSPGINNPKAHLMDWAAARARRSSLGSARRPRPSSPSTGRSFPNAKPLEILGLAGADLFRRGAVLQAERKAAQGGAPAYLYWFGWKTPVLDGRPLAYHCQDLAMWFDNIDLAAQATGGGADRPRPGVEDERRPRRVRAHRQPEPRRHPEVGAVHRKQSRDDDLGHDVRGEDRSGSRGAAGAQLSWIERLAMKRSQVRVLQGTPPLSVVLSGHIGNTFGPKGFSIGSTRMASSSKDPVCTA